MYFFKLFTFVCALGIAWAMPAATSTYADFLSALKTVEPSVATLDAKIAAFTTTIAQAYEVQAAAAVVIKTNTATFNFLATVKVDFSVAQAHEVLQIIASGEVTVKKTLNDLVAKKPLFAKYYLHPLVASSLRQLRGVVVQLGLALEAKATSADLHTQAVALYNQIIAAIDVAIVAFSS